MAGFKIALFALLYSIASLAKGSKCPEDAISKLVVCYYEGESPLTTLNICNCTHVIFTNAVKRAENNSISATEGTLDYLEVIKEKKENLTTIFTLETKSDDVLKSVNKSEQLINSIVDFLQESQFEGVELNFKFSSDDGITKDSFSSFVKNLSKTLSSHHRRVKRDGYDVFEKLQDDITTVAYTTQTPKNSTSRAPSIKRSRKTKANNRKIREKKDEDENDNADYLTLEEAINTEFSAEKQNSLKDVEDDAVAAGEDKKLLVFVRLSVRPEIIGKKYDLKSLSRYADILTVPTHNIVNKDEEHLTYHPSRLMGLSDILNTDSVLDFLTGMGGLKSKMVISIPGGVLKFQLEDEKKNTPRSPTISKPQVIDQSQLCGLFSKNNWTLERDDDLTAPYAFSGKTWLAFEDEISVNIKGKYILLRELAGGAIYPIDYDLNDGSCANRTGLGGYLTGILRKNFESLGRKPRALVLESLQDEIHDVSFVNAQAGVQVSEYRIVRVVDHSGAVHVIRKNTKTQFECSRQGYFSHPLGCNKFYRCVKFDQYSNEFTVFEYDCPAGLAFDERWEVCVWPGSLPHGAPCTGSSEIAPVPRSHYQCPSHEGYFADPENCRWFFACLDHARDGITPLTAYEFRCPFGLVFSEEKLACDWPWLVGSCGNRGAAAYLNINAGGQTQGIHSATFINGGNLEATFGQYDNLDQRASFVGFGQKFGSGLRDQSGYQGAQSAGYGYIASQFDDGREKGSFAAFPDYEISGGRIFNKGGVVLNENIAGGVNIKGGSADQSAYYQQNIVQSGIREYQKLEPASTTARIVQTYLTPRPFSVNIPSVQINEEYSTVGSTTPQPVVTSTTAHDENINVFQGIEQVTGKQYSTPRGFTASPTAEVHRFGQASLRQKIPAGISVVSQSFGAKESVSLPIPLVTSKPDINTFEYTASGHVSQPFVSTASPVVSFTQQQTITDQRKAFGKSFVSSNVPAVQTFSNQGQQQTGVPLVAVSTPSSVVDFTQQHSITEQRKDFGKSVVSIDTTAVNTFGIQGQQHTGIPLVSTPSPVVDFTQQQQITDQRKGSGKSFVSVNIPAVQTHSFGIQGQQQSVTFGNEEGQQLGGVPLVTVSTPSPAVDYTITEQRKGLGKSVVSVDIPAVQISSFGNQGHLSAGVTVSSPSPVVGFTQRQTITEQRKGFGKSVFSAETPSVHSFSYQGQQQTGIPLVSVSTPSPAVGLEQQQQVTEQRKGFGSSGVSVDIPAFQTFGIQGHQQTVTFNSGEGQQSAGVPSVTVSTPSPVVGFAQQQTVTEQRKGFGKYSFSAGTPPVNSFSYQGQQQTGIPLVSVSTPSPIVGLAQQQQVTEHRKGLGSSTLSVDIPSVQTHSFGIQGQQQSGVPLVAVSTPSPIVGFTKQQTVAKQSKGFSSSGVSVDIPAFQTFGFDQGQQQQTLTLNTGEGQQSAGVPLVAVSTPSPVVDFTQQQTITDQRKGFGSSVVNVNIPAVQTHNFGVKEQEKLVGFTQQQIPEQRKGLGNSFVSVDYPAAQTFGNHEELSAGVPAVPVSTPSPVVGYTQQHTITEQRKGLGSSILNVDIPAVQTHSFGIQGQQQTGIPVVSVTTTAPVTSGFAHSTLDEKVSNELKFSKQNTYSPPAVVSKVTSGPTFHSFSQSGVTPQPDINLSGFYGEHVTPNAPFNLPGVTSTVKNSFETSYSVPVSLPQSKVSVQEEKQSYSIPVATSKGSLFKPAFGQRYSYSSSYKQSGSQFGTVQPFGAVSSTLKPATFDQQKTVTEVTVEQQPIVSVGTISSAARGFSHSNLNFKSDVQPQVVTTAAPTPIYQSDVNLYKSPITLKQQEKIDLESYSPTYEQSGKINLDQNSYLEEASVTPSAVYQQSNVNIYKSPVTLQQQEKISVGSYSPAVEQTVVNIPGKINLETSTGKSTFFGKTDGYSSLDYGNQILLEEQPKAAVGQQIDLLKTTQVTTAVPFVTGGSREQLVGLEITKSVEVNPEEFFQSPEQELPVKTIEIQQQPLEVISQKRFPIKQQTYQQKGRGEFQQQIPQLPVTQNIYSEGSLSVFEPSKTPQVVKTETKYLPPSGFVRNSAKNVFVEKQQPFVTTEPSTLTEELTVQTHKNFDSKRINNYGTTLKPAVSIFQPFDYSFKRNFTTGIGSGFKYAVNPNIEIPEPPKEYILAQNGFTTAAPTYYQSTESFSNGYESSTHGSFGEELIYDKGQGIGGSNEVNRGSSTVRYEVSSTTPKQRTRGRLYHGDITSNRASNKYEEYDINGDSKTTIDLKNLKVDKDKKTVIVVSQVSDANPVLIGKLAGQCSCQSNMLELRTKGKKSKGKGKNTPRQHSLITNEYLPPYEGSQSKIEIETIGSSTAEPETVVIGAKQNLVSSTTAEPVSSTILSSLGPDGVLSITPKTLFTEQKVRSKSKQFRGRTRYLPPTSLLSEDGIPLLSPVPASEIASTFDYSILESRRQNEIDGGSAKPGAAFDRYGPGGWRGFDETLQGSIDCKRPGLFRHPKHCNKFYACNYDPWKEQYTLHVFNCPIHLTYDSSISACNWPVRGPACADDNLLV